MDIERAAFAALAYYAACLACWVPAILITNRTDRTTPAVFILPLAPAVVLLHVLRRMPTTRLVLAFVAGAVLFVLAGCDGYEQARVSSRHYCEMVDLYKRTGGDRGWPAYRGQRECAEFTDSGF